MSVDLRSRHTDGNCNACNENAMSAKHTPGPWCVNGHAIEQDKPRDALAVAYVEDVQNDAWRANAKLIAAAPVLADALEIVMEALERRGLAIPLAGSYAALRAAGRIR